MAATSSSCPLSFAQSSSPDSEQPYLSIGISSNQTPRQSNIKSLASDFVSLPSTRSEYPCSSATRGDSRLLASSSTCLTPPNRSSFPMLNDHHPMSSSRRHSLFPSANLMTLGGRGDVMIHGTNNNNNNNITLEEQQLANQKLQQRIMENIRQQQQLMRELIVQGNKSKMASIVHKLNNNSNNNTNVNHPHLHHHSNVVNASSSSSLTQVSIPPLSTTMNLLQQSLTQSLPDGSGSSGMHMMLRQQQQQVYNPSNMLPPTSSVVVACPHSFHSSRGTTNNHNINTTRNPPPPPPPPPNSFHW